MQSSAAKEYSPIPKQIPSFQNFPSTHQQKAHQNKAFCSSILTGFFFPFLQNLYLHVGPVLTRGLPNKLCGFDNMLNFVEGFQDVPVEE